MLVCFVMRIDNVNVEPMRYEIDRTNPNSDGENIFHQQNKIPDYNPQKSYLISCGDILYDVDRIGWYEI